MVLSVFNNTHGGGKSTLLYSLLIYLETLNKKRRINLFDLYEDNLIFKGNNILKERYKGISNYSDLADDADVEIYNKFAGLYIDKDLHFFNTVGRINNSHSMLLLYSKFIIVPVIPTYYYLNSIHNFISMVNSIYKTSFIPNEEIVEAVKEFPVLIFVPMHFEISDEIKKTFENIEYGNGGMNKYFLETTYPFLEYRRILDYNMDIESINSVNKEISNVIFNF